MRRQALRAALTSYLLAGLVFSHAGGQAPPERWVLVYSGGPHRPAYTVNDLVRLLAVVDTSGHPIAPLCNGVILTEYQAVSGRYYMPWTNGIPATAADWTQYLDSIFAPPGPLARLDSAAAIAGPTQARKLAVAIMVPYPNPSGESGPFSDHDRIARVEAHLREVMRRVHGVTLNHIAVSAFYWLNEGVVDADTAMVSRVAAVIHDMGMRFLWIPSWGAHNATRWRALGFDEAWQQPNYFFHTEIMTSRVDSAVERARSADMGLELEFDRRLFSNSQFENRLDPYIAALEKAPDLRRKSIAIYEGGGAMIQLSRSNDAAHRTLYDRLVAMLRPDRSP